MKPPPLKDRMYQIVAQIPRGKVLSYGALAILAGRVGAARAAGAAMRSVPPHLKLPCHRVLKSDGTLPPARIFQGRQKSRLQAEGVRFTPAGRVDMAACEWLGPTRKKQSRRD